MSDGGHRRTAREQRVHWHEGDQRIVSLPVALVISGHAFGA